jgi:pyrroloquinoline quinone biosynthesis protein B
MLRFTLSFLIAALLLVSGCATTTTTRSTPTSPETPFVIVLGVAQDAGYPQAACRRDGCALAWADPTRARLVSCLAIVDPVTGQRWLIDATPDFREQLHRLDAIAPPTDPGNITQPALTGILLTHAHIGHYTGLMDLGREVIGAADVPVYAMPRMRTFLETNAPWSQLVSQRNIILVDLQADTPIALNDRITVTPILVPHRDEYSETVGFRIEGPQRSVLYIPDIDKWDRWDRTIEDEIHSADIAYIDGTFYRNGEIPGRDMSQIPHPFIEETMTRLSTLDPDDRKKVHFIHFNHTNPILWSESARAAVRAAGFNIASECTPFDLGPQP